MNRPEEEFPDEEELPQEIRDLMDGTRPVDLPELHKIAMKSLPNNLVEIIFDSIDKGESEQVRDARIQEAKGQQLDSN